MTDIQKINATLMARSVVVAGERRPVMLDHLLRMGVQAARPGAGPEGVGEQVVTLVLDIAAEVSRPLAPTARFTAAEQRYIRTIHTYGASAEEIAAQFMADTAQVQFVLEGPTMTRKPSVSKGRRLMRL